MCEKDVPECSYKNNSPEYRDDYYNYHASKRAKVSFSERDNKNDLQPFEKYQRDLNKIFFNDSEIIEDLNDFWLFVRKYEIARLKSKIPAQDQLDRIDFINLKLLKSDEELFKRIPFHDDAYGRRLSKETVREFKYVILLYLDFKQKENFNKLRKLKNDQANLPIAEFKEQIVETVKEERVIIIAGDTGCGKSTQVPQYLLNAGFSRIACTQPRRIACISLCKRVAHETLNQYGSEVGFQIRFEKNRRQETKIIFITEGLLLRQVSSDSKLSSYDVVVLDEVHERHLQGDFLLGVLKCLLLQRSDLKLVLMSATINIDLFANYFGGNAKIIQVPGRLFPIKLNYHPITAEDQISKKDKINPAPYVRILHLIDDKYPREERGDVLIFLSGMNEITTIVDAAKAYNEKINKWIILPLHSSLSISDQDKVFDYPPEGMRKCIVSTNIAETSVTIDGIRFVVDSGMVKEMSYDPVCRMQRLKEFWISKASAEQRKGRAGRTGPGVCFRLYSEEDYAALEEYTKPEILRVPLDSLLLQMLALGLPDARKFPFVEPPHPDAIENAISSLKQHGALSEMEKLRPLGSLLSRLPVDLSLGKMLIMGSMFHQAQPVLSLAAALSVQNPFTNRAFRDPECESLRKELESDHGDPITLLNALREWLELKSQGYSERSASRKWCKRRGLEEQRFYEMVKLRNQFNDLLEECSLLKPDKDIVKGETSAERALRHGELKLLRSLKQGARETKNEKKRLRPDSWRIENDESEATDIRDVDLRLSHDRNRLQSLVDGATACSYKDLTMLKIILCSGLYPQISIPDEFNNCKSVGDQLFHTKGKPFVFLHPLSFFGNNSKVLQLEEGDIVEAPGFSSRRPLSAKHQILFYMSLLETNKPYLVNTLRMPAAQTLLLMANELHTNADFTRILCDSWIELTFPAPPPIEKLILKIVKLRDKWELMLKLRLEESDCGTIEQDLADGLLDVMNAQILYSMKRILPADLKVAYCTGNDSIDLKGPNPFLPTFEMSINSKLGGIQVTPYLNYNCLFDDSIEIVSWECPHCGMFAPLSALERLQHLHICNPIEFQAGPSPQKEKIVERKPNSQAYHCSICEKEFILTPIEILKHKKSHI